MSSKSSSQTKYANSNLNNVLSKSTSTTGQGTSAGTINRFNGMLVLSKRPRSATGAKLAVPKPVNLPSIKKEHAGNDPNTQLVPSGTGSGSWTKPAEEAPPAPAPVPEAPPRQSSLTAGSTWASQPRAAGSTAAAWQPPPQPSFGARPAAPSDRHLNPEEYPSLAATAKVQFSSKQGAKLAYEAQQDTRAWADDERAPPGGGYRGPGEQWGPRPGERFDDDRYAGDRPSWEGAFRDRPAPNRDGDGPYGRPAFDEDFEFNRGRGYDAYGHLRDQPPPPPRRGGFGYDRFETSFGSYDAYDDRSLFPPPPPPRNQPGVRDDGEASDDEDEERKAFEAELERVKAEMEKKKYEERESISEKRSVHVDDDATGSQADSFAPSDSEAHPPPPPPPRPSSRLQPRNRDQEEEEEKRRKEAAAAKLKHLEQQMAARNAAEVAIKGGVAGGRPKVLRDMSAKDEDLSWEDRDEPAAKAAREGDEAPEKPKGQAARAPQPSAASQAAPPPPPPPPSQQHQQQQQQPPPKQAWQPRQQPPPAWQQQQQHAPQQAQQQHAQQAPPPPPAWHHQQQQQQQNAQQASPRPGPAWQQQQPQGQAMGLPPPPPPHQQMSAPPPPPTWQPPTGKPLTAMFGSFDENLLEELTSRTPSQQPQQTGPQQVHLLQHPQQHPQHPQQQHAQEAAQPKAWRPVEGTTPVLLTHGPGHQQQQRPPSWDTPATPTSTAATAADGSKVEPTGRPPRDSSTRGRWGRGGDTGRSGRGGRGPRSSGEAVATPDSGAEDAGSGREASGDGSSAALAAESGPRRSGRGGRIDRGGAGPSEAAEAGAVRGGRGGRSGRGGRGGRGETGPAAAGSTACGVATNSRPTEEAAGDAPSDSGFVEVRAKRERRGSREGLLSKDGDQSSGYRAASRGRGEGRSDSAPLNGRAGPARQSAGSAASPTPGSESETATGPTPWDPLDEPRGGAPAASVVSAGPTVSPAPAEVVRAAADKAAAPPPAPATPVSLPWAKAAPNLDPVLDATAVVGVPPVKLPTILDPLPSKSSPIGFERSIGPKTSQAGLKSAEKEAPPSSVLDNGMPQLPADLNLDVLPSPPNSTTATLVGFVTGPAAASGIRHAPGSFFGAGSSPGGPGSGPGDGGSGGWDQPPGLGGFGSHPGGLQPPPHPGASGLLPFSYNPNGPSMFSGAGPLGGSGGPAASGPIPTSGSASGSGSSAPGSQLQHAPPPLLLNVGQFGQFSAPFAAPPPRPFGPPGGYGGLGSGFFGHQPQPFLPTNKQPDWSTGPGPIGITAQPGALGTLGRLDLPVPTGFTVPSGGGGPEGGNAPGSAFSRPGSSGPLMPPPGMSNLAPGGFGGPPKPGGQGGNLGMGSGPQMGGPKLGGGLQHQGGMPGTGLGGPGGYGGHSQGGMMQHHQHHHQQQQHHHHHHQQQQQQAPHLPDDIFGLDPQPAPFMGPSHSLAAQQAMQGRQQQVAAAAQQGIPPQGGTLRNAAVPPPPPPANNNQGNRTGGRGRGGRVDGAPVVVGGRDSIGRGFAGRSGRGAGRGGPGPADTPVREAASSTVPGGPSSTADISTPATAAAAAAAASVAVGSATAPAGGAPGGRGSIAGRVGREGGRGGRGGRGGLQAESAAGRGGGLRAGRSGGRGGPGTKMVYVAKGQAAGGEEKA